MYTYTTDQLTELFKIYYETVLTENYSLIQIPATHIAKFIIWLQESDKTLLINP